MKTNASTKQPPWANIPATYPLMRERQVRQETGLPDSTRNDLIKAGLFPPPIKIGPRAVAWPRVWLDAFLQARAEQSRDSAVASPRRKVV